MTENQLSSDQKRYKTEAPFTKDVNSWLNVQLDVVWYKASDRFQKGVSDFVLCVGGIFTVLELKRADNKVSVHQDEFIKDIRKSGGVAGACYTMADVKALVTEAREKAAKLQG